MSLFSYDSFLYKIYDSVISTLANISWCQLKATITGRPYYNLTDQDLDHIREQLASGYYIIATFHKTSLSSYLVAIANFVTTGTFGQYSHVVLNLEDCNPTEDEKFQLYQSTRNGTTVSSFMEVFDCDSVVLLRPKSISISEWENVVENAKKCIGKPYDDLFDLNDDTRVSCVELVRNALKGVDNYDTKFANLEAMIKEFGNLTPQMIVDCDDFEHVWEVRR